MKKVLLTTLGYTEDALEVSFYHSEDENGQRKYCTGISVAEAGTKYILSKHNIDEIVVVGPAQTVNSGDITEAVSLKDNAFRPYASYEDYSEYGFYLYRLQQFMNDLDIESQGLTEILTPQRAAELEEDISVLKKQFGIRQSQKTFFNSVDTDSEKISEILKYADENYSKPEAVYIAYCLYREMDSRYKMFPLDSNLDVKVRFLPIETEKDNAFNTIEIRTFMDDFEKSGDTDISIYIDLQGFGFVNAFTLYNLIQVYKNVGKGKIEIVGVIQSTYSPNAISNPIIDEWERVELQKLVTSTTVFLNYGKSDGVCEYCNKYVNDNAAVRHLVAGMKYVDEGISLCNIAALKYGVGVIREALKSGSQEDGIAFKLLSNLIIRDYDTMLEGNDVAITELLKWAIKKKMYQQALSIIESHIPADMVKRGIFYYARNEKDIENLKKELNVYYWNETVKCRYFFNDISHYMLKSVYRDKIDHRGPKDQVSRKYAAMHVRRTHNMVEGALPAYSELNDDVMLQELLALYLNIGNLRNEVCHAVMPENALEGGAEVEDTDRMDLIGKNLSHFMNLYLAACDRVKDKTYTSVELENDAFKAYTCSHRLIPFAQEEGILEQNCSCMFNGKEVTIKIRMQDVPEEEE